MRVFSKKAFIKWLTRHGYTSEEIQDFLQTTWVIKCFGKTRNQCTKMRISTVPEWFVDIEKEFIRFIEGV